MATVSSRAGRGLPGVLIGAWALLAFSAAALTGCSSKVDPAKPAGPGAGAASAPKGASTPETGATPEANKTTAASSDAGKTANAAGAGTLTGPLAYVPKDAYAFVLVRPKRIFESELVKALPEDLIQEGMQEFEKENPTGIDFRKAESISIAVLPPPKEAGLMGERGLAILFKHGDPLDPTKLLEKAKEEGGEVTEQTHAGKKYWRIAPPAPGRKRPAAPAVPAPPDEAPQEKAATPNDDELQEDEASEEEEPAIPDFPAAQKKPSPLALVMLDDRTALGGHESVVLGLLDGATPGPLTDRLKGVSLDQDLVVAVFPGGDPLTAIAAGGATQNLGEEQQAKIGEQIENTKAVLVTADLTGDTLLKVTIEGKTEEVAQQTQAQLNTFKAMLGGIYQQQTAEARLDDAPEEQKAQVAFADKLMAGLSVSRDGNDTSVTVKNPGDWAALKPSFEAAAKEARKAAQRTVRRNNLKMIGLAAHNYHDAHNSFPPAKEGKGLSWRVHLLPYLDEAPLYNQFKLDEPWDSEHNKALIEKMPKVFASEEVKEPGKTRIVGFSGEGAPFGREEGLRIRDVTDGTSNTIFAVDVAPEKAVIWTKPEDAPFDPEDPKAALGDLSKDGVVIALLMDGSVRTISSLINAEVFKGLITFAGGEVVGEF